MFKVGDRVRRTGPSYGNMEKGMEAKVVGIDVHYMTVLLNNGASINTNPMFWELVEPVRHNHHPHHDLIIAWAKGAEIETRASESFSWQDKHHSEWLVDWQYRIKPTNRNAERIERIEQEMRRLADELKELRDD